ncbi:hypothetical protein [Proteus mirabilis]|uniref:hypothetical protein n=1 Tax=Proteus mirabilis TaxID=584 RepID=UPI00389687C4
MISSVYVRDLYLKCKVHGAGDASVTISDSEIIALINISMRNLGWNLDDCFCIDLPSSDYYEIPLDWFDGILVHQISSQYVMDALKQCIEINMDFALFISNLCALHRRRCKFRRILSNQPMPTMEQIGPRILLEYGEVNNTLLANWMLWRKWIYDIDNRSAQETGYLFEPLLASCMGGAPVGATNSPVKRLDSNGKITNKGRQIDCLVPDRDVVYELKLRVTIAASGQGRFSEELSFPEESQAAGFKPILLVLDPSNSNRLTELSRKYLDCGGEFYHGDSAWEHMKINAGDVISVFIEKYIRPAIDSVDDLDFSCLDSLNLHWRQNEIEVGNANSTYVIKRTITAE